MFLPSVKNGLIWGCVHSTYASFRPFLTPPPPCTVIKFITMAWPPSSPWLRTYYVHSPQHKKECDKTLKFSDHAFYVILEQRLPQSLFHLSRVQAATGLNLMLRLPRRRDFLQTVLRQKLWPQRLRLWRNWVRSGSNVGRAGTIRRRENLVSSRLTARLRFIKHA